MRAEGLLLHPPGGQPLCLGGYREQKLAGLFFPKGKGAAQQHEQKLWGALVQFGLGWFWFVFVAF